jgi:hypothetical protein
MNPAKYNAKTAHTAYKIVKSMGVTLGVFPTEESKMGRNPG